MEFKPPANDRVCDADGTELERRSDDDELTVRRRLALYREQTAPLEAFYRERKLLLEIDAEVLEGEVADAHDRRAGGPHVIIRKSPEELDRMRRAGRIVADTISAVLDAVRPGATTADLDEVAESYIRGQTRDAVVQGLSRHVPGDDLRVDRRRDRARHPVGRPARSRRASSSRSTSVRSGTGSMPTRR